MLSSLVEKKNQTPCQDTCIVQRARTPAQPDRYQGLTNTITTSPCSSDSDRLREEVTKIFPHLDESAEIIRLGKVPSPQNARPRPVLIKTTRPNKAQAFLAKHQLRTRSLFVNHDLTREKQHRRREVVSTYKELRRRAIKCTLPYDQILFEGRAMTDEDVAKHLADTDEPDSQ